jgi:hypothetical protein
MYIQLKHNVFKAVHPIFLPSTIPAEVVSLVHVRPHHSQYRVLSNIRLPANIPVPACPSELGLQHPRLQVS